MDGVQLMWNLSLTYLYVVLAALQVSGDERHSQSSVRLWGYVFGGIFLFLLSRLPVLYFDVVINPDEALMAANAMKSHYGWLNWNMVDPLTAGPLDSMVLAFPYAFGGDVTLFSTRLMGVLLWSVSFAVMVLAIRRLSSMKWAICITLPVHAFFILTTFSDFIHYTSELLPLCIICLSIFLGVEAFFLKKFSLLLAASFLLGCMPFAKLQGLPISLTCLAFIFFLITSRAFGSLRWVVKVPAFIVSASLPALIFMIPLYLAGGIDDFVKSYFTQQQLRIAGRPWMDMVPSMVAGGSCFWVLIAPFALVAVVSVLCVLLPGRRWLRIGRKERWVVFFAITIFASSYVSVATPGRNFTHYLLFFVPSLLVLGCASCMVIEQCSSEQMRGSLGVAKGLFVLISALFVFSSESMFNDEPSWFRGWQSDVYRQGYPFRSNHLLQWLQPTAGDTLLCWGWRPGCYVDSGIPPATREATNENQLYSTSLRGYFRQRLLTDFSKTQPDFVVDVVARGGLLFVDQELYGLNTFPELFDILDRDFVLYSSVPDQYKCPRLFLRKSRAMALDAQRVRFRKIVADASEKGFDVASLDDGSVFETCRDFWLAPAGQGGKISIVFDKDENISRLMLLNSRHGAVGDRSARTVELQFLLAGRIVRIVRGDLNRFPHWTSFDVADLTGMVDAVNIRILAFDGKSGALNEVKVYRK